MSGIQSDVPFTCERLIVDLVLHVAQTARSEAADQGFLVLHD